MDGRDRMDLEDIFKQISIGFDDWLERRMGGMDKEKQIRRKMSPILVTEMHTNVGVLDH